MRRNSDFHFGHHLHRWPREEGELFYVHRLHVFNGGVWSGLRLPLRRLFHSSPRELFRLWHCSHWHITRSSQMDRGMVGRLHNAGHSAHFGIWFNLVHSNSRMDLFFQISIPFFAFPKSLKPKSKTGKRLRSQSTELDEQTIQKIKYTATESARNTLSSVHRSQSPYHNKPHQYGRTIKEIPTCMWRLLTNPVYITTCLGSCMELAIVSGFLVFLPKYLETQFSLGKSEANLFAGGIAVPGACVGIFLGGYVLKRFQMKPKGAIQFVLFFNLVCMGLYTALYFLGCDNVRMAGTTLPYANKYAFGW